MNDLQIPCRILLIHTYMVHQTDPELALSDNDSFKERSKAGLEAERLEALKHNKNPHISIETSSHMGSLNNVIQHLLKKEKIDLVAMGKNGGRHVASVATMLKKLKCPLLITHNHSDHH